MSKGEQTRNRIVERAAPVFNTHGFNGTSLADLVRATGLEKGGIYNHFESKEALAVAAFDHAVQMASQRYAVALEGKQHALDRLLTIVEIFAQQATEPWIPGGCPIANIACEASDTLPMLRAHAQTAMIDLQKLIGSNVKRGVLADELRPDADPYTVASLVTALLEGALLLCLLLDDLAHMQRAIDHISAYLRGLALPSPESS